MTKAVSAKLPSHRFLRFGKKRRSIMPALMPLGQRKDCLIALPKGRSCRLREPKPTPNTGEMWSAQRRDPPCPADKGGAPTESGDIPVKSKENGSHRNS